MTIFKRNFQAFMNQATAAVLIAILPSVTLAAGQGRVTPATQGVPNNSAHASGDAAKKRPRLFNVVSPKPNDSFVSAGLTMTLEISTDAERRSLAATINGSDITALFRENKHCGFLGCTESARLNLKAGLQAGQNKVRFQMNSKGRRNSQEVREFKFDWKPSSPNLGLTDSSLQLAPVLAFSTKTPGGQVSGTPWFQIYSNALNGGTMTYPSGDPCTGQYQIVAINRQTLQADSDACYADDASFSAALAALNPSDPSQKPDLIVAGTTLGNNAGSKLNTTSIGGTDYSKYANADLPLGYMIIGVPGAAAGSAYENYYVNTDDTTDIGYDPQINGILAVDASGNYNFFGYDSVPYSVDANQGIITVKGYSYTPPANVQNGLWLLQFDRWTLDSNPLCGRSGTSVTNCGQVFDIGSANSETAAQALTDLTTALSSARHKDLIFLTTIGSNPFGTVPTAAFSSTLETLGFPASTFNEFATDNTTGAKISLVTSSDPNVSKSMIGGNIAVSSSSYFKQGETGSIYGLLARDQHSFYRPIATMQGGAAPSSGSLDDFFSMNQIPWRQPGPWNSLASSNLQAAYRYLSYTIVQAATSKGTKSDDIHSIYVSSLNNELVDQDPTTAPMPAMPWLDPVDNQDYTFSSSDLAAEAALLQTELGNLKQSINFATTIQPFINGSNSDVLTILSAASKMASELNLPTSTNVSLNLSNVSNFAGAICSLAVLGLSSEDQPILSAFSGLFWAAGSAQLFNPGSSYIPTPWSNLTNTVDYLSSNASLIEDNVNKTWGTILDNVYSDQANLAAFAYNSNNGWAAKNELSYQNVSDQMNASANLSFYTQLFASINSVDYYGAYPFPITDPSQIYTLKQTNCSGIGQCFYSCEDTYGKSIQASGWTSWPSIGVTSPTVDYYVIGGPIKDNGTTNASEIMPEETSITTLFGTAAGDFNLSPDMFYSSNGPLTRRTGYQNVNYGWGFCKRLGSDTPADVKPR
jgi:hypothetical protein